MSSSQLLQQCPAVISRNLVKVEDLIHRNQKTISIWPIDGTLTGPTTPDQDEPKSNDNEGALNIAGVKPHHHMHFSVISRNHIGLG